MALVKYLKIILLQCFQFSVFSNKRYLNRPYIYTWIEPNSLFFFFLIIFLGVVFVLHVLKLGGKYVLGLWAKFNCSNTLASSFEAKFKIDLGSADWISQLSAFWAFEP